MMPEKDKPSSRTTARQPGDPGRCPECGQKEVRPAVINYTARKSHDGRLYEREIPALHVSRCAGCGEVYLGSEADEQIATALRSRLQLLSPAEIREGIAALKFSQKQFAEAIGVAPESVSRWVTGAMIQSRLADNAMRWFFGIPAVRTAARSAHMVH